MCEILPVLKSKAAVEATPQEAFADSTFGNATWNTLISSDVTPSSDLSCGVGYLNPKDGLLCLHRHKQAELYHITYGSAIVTIDGEDIQVTEGDTIFIPGDAEHGIKNLSEDLVKWFYVFPCGNFKDVIYKFSNLQ